jgi:hypothetical protein
MTLGNMRDRQICMSALIYIKVTRCVMSKMDNNSFDITDHDFSDAPPSHRWCDGCLLKLQSSRRYALDRQVRQAIPLVL